MRSHFFLIFALMATARVYADVDQSEEIVSSFSNRVTQELHPAERNYLLEEWQRRKHPVIQGLRDGNENSRRLCSQAIEASADGELGVELLAAYAIETDERAQVAIIHAIGSCHPSLRALALAESRFRDDPTMAYKIAWSTVLIKNGHQESSVYWDFLTDGLKIADDPNQNEIDRRAETFRIRYVCQALIKIGTESQKVLPRLVALSKDGRLGVVTRSDIKDAISAIEFMVKREKMLE